MIQFDKSFCTGGGGGGGGGGVVDRPTMNSKDNFIWMSNGKNIFLNLQTCYVKTHGFHDNQSFKSNPKEWVIPPKILIAHQQLILGYKAWYQVNAMS